LNLPAAFLLVLFSVTSHVYVLEPLEGISTVYPNYLVWQNLYTSVLHFLSTLKKPQLSFFDYLLGCVIRESASVE
jgi:hypothetical protein